MAKLHLVWNGNRTECVGFLDEKDADWTATGKPKWRLQLGVPQIGAEFRHTYGEDAKRLPQSVVEIDLAALKSGGA